MAMHQLLPTEPIGVAQPTLLGAQKPPASRNQNFTQGSVSGRPGSPAPGTLVSAYGTLAAAGAKVVTKVTP